MGIENLSKHAADYKPGSWEAYTEEELEWWVKLLTKRSGHRDNEDKKKKDIYDAANYQSMLDEKRKAGAK